MKHHHQFKNNPIAPAKSKTYCLRLAMFAFGCGLIGVLVLCSGIFYIQLEFLAQPWQNPVMSNPAHFNRPYQDVTLTTTDGVPISAWYIDGPRPQAVILVHGIHANRTAMMAEAALLVEAGYQLLMLDLRGHGNSGSTELTYGYNEALDVRAATDYLATLPNVEAIGILGHSFGGAAVARAAADDPRLKAVIIQSSFSSLSRGVEDAFDNYVILPQWPFEPLVVGMVEWRVGVNSAEVDSAAALAKVAPRPVMIIHGTEDDTFPVVHGYDLYAAAQEPKYFWEVEGLWHVNAAAVDPEGFKENVLPFLDKALR